jgi:KTSC domain
VIAVQSSNLAAIDYDWSGTLTIAFHSGGVYEFYHVPQSEYHGLMSASSHGKYFHAHIKGRYSCRKISG